MSFQKDWTQVSRVWSHTPCRNVREHADSSVDVEAVLQGIAALYQNTMIIIMTVVMLKVIVHVAVVIVVEPADVVVVIDCRSSSSSSSISNSSAQLLAVQVVAIPVQIIVRVKVVGQVQQ